MRLFPARGAAPLGMLRWHSTETIVPFSSTDDIVISRPLIDINEPQQITYWTTAFGVSELQLRYAVAAAGESIGDIRDYLGVK